MKKLIFCSSLFVALFLAFAFTPANNASSNSEAVMAGCCGVINVTPSGFCSGTQTYTLNNETAGTSTAYTPGSQVVLDPNAKYTLTITSTGTCALTVSYFLCGNTASETVVVNAGKPASVDLIQGAGPFCFE